jgi:hypothetical protein
VVKDQNALTGGIEPQRNAPRRRCGSTNLLVACHLIRWHGPLLHETPTILPRFSQEVADSVHAFCNEEGGGQLRPTSHAVLSEFL